jgi:hypothetical protein
VTPSDPTWGLAPLHGAIAVDEAAAALVADALSEATPRSATLALLRFDEYLGLMRRAGLDVCPSGPLARALRAGLTQVCRTDAAPARVGSDSTLSDDG